MWGTPRFLSEVRNNHLAKPDYKRDRCAQPLVIQIPWSKADVNFLQGISVKCVCALQLIVLAVSQQSLLKTYCSDRRNHPEYE